MNIPADIAGANDGATFVPYEVEGTLGRAFESRLTGPPKNFSGDNNVNQLIMYKRPGLLGPTFHVLFPGIPHRDRAVGQSPPTEVKVSRFSLPRPVKGVVDNNGNLPITLAGAFEVTTAKPGTGKQRIVVSILVPQGNEAPLILESFTKDIDIPDNAWNGLLFGYKFETILKVDKINKTITGNAGTIGPTPFPVLQRLIVINSNKPPFNSELLMIP